MLIFKNYEAARAAEVERKVDFVEIREISETEWHAYETQEEVPPEPKT